MSHRLGKEDCFFFFFGNKFGFAVSTSYITKMYDNSSIFNLDLILVYK